LWFCIQAGRHKAEEVQSELSAIHFGDDEQVGDHAAIHRTSTVTAAHAIGSPVAEKILRERIAEDIYAAYTPTYYQRRHVLEQNVEGDLTGPGMLLVTSTADASPSLVPGYSFENRYPGASSKCSKWATWVSGAGISHVPQWLWRREALKKR